MNNLYLYSLKFVLNSREFDLYFAKKTLVKVTKSIWNA